MKKILFVLCILILNNSSAQNLQNANWCFGINAGVNFISTPTAITSAIGFGNPGGSTRGTSVSNDIGQLQFYTDDINIWDKNDNMILDGTSGNGIYGYTEIGQQNSVIVPKPGNPNLYYIFTLGTTDITNTGASPIGLGGIHYTVIDVSSGTAQVAPGLKNVIINSHNGDPIEYAFDYAHTEDNPVFISMKSRMTTTLHVDGDKIWLTIIPDFYFNHQHTRYFYSFLISANGINGLADGVSPQPYFSTLLDATYYTNNWQWTTACMKISPNGHKLCDAEEIVVNLYDFDNSTGEINTAVAPTVVFNPTWDGYHSIGYGLEFSAGSNRIYFTDNPYGFVQSGFAGGGSRIKNYASLYQYDIESHKLRTIYDYPPITKDKDIITPLPVDYPFGIQLALDGKIYLCAYGPLQEYFDNLGVINLPDLLGTACDFVPDQFQLAPNTFQNGVLPQWVHKASCGVTVSPRGPINYYLPVDAAPNGRILTSNISTGNQWYYNNVAIPGATAQTYTVGSGWSSTATGNYSVLNNGCMSNTVHVEFKQYGYGNYGEDILDRLGAKIHPVQTSGYYCYNTNNNFIQQFDLGPTALYTWNFRVWPTGGTQNVSITPGSYNPNSNQAQVNIGGSTGAYTYVQGVADLNGSEIILDYYLTLSHPDFIPTNQEVCANAGQYIQNFNGSSISTLPGGSGFDWEFYDFGSAATIISGPGIGQSWALTPGRSTPQQMVVRYTGPSFIQKHFYYNWGGCYKEEYNVTLYNGCILGKEASTQNKIYIYPNPASHQISISSNEVMNYIEISDFMNPTLKRIKINGSKSIRVNVSDLKPGVYTCRIITGKGIENQKLIIKR